MTKGLEDSQKKNMHYIMAHLVSSYRLGDLYEFGDTLKSHEIQELVDQNPETIGAEYALHSKIQHVQCIETMADIALRHLETHRSKLPADISDATLVHLRLGDVVAGTAWHEQLKRPLDPSVLRSLLPADSRVYVIGQCFFAAESSTNYEECIDASETYLQKVLTELDATHFEGGHADIDLCCALAAKRFVQGRGFFSKLIVALRKHLALDVIETEVLESLIP